MVSAQILAKFELKIHIKDNNAEFEYKNQNPKTEEYQLNEIILNLQLQMLFKVSNSWIKYKN